MTDIWGQLAIDDAPLPPAAAAALQAVAAAWDDDATATAALADALAAAPERLAVHMAAYKVHFYKHRYAQALPHAEACLVHAARRLGVAESWPQVTALPADGPWPRFWLFSLKAWGYVALRLGRADDGHAALAHVAALDPADAVGARPLIAAAARVGRDDDEE